MCVRSTECAQSLPREGLARASVRLFASTVAYIHDQYYTAAPSPPVDGLHLGVVDSGNNRHHCFTDPLFFPAGVRWGRLNITGAHGAQVVTVGRGTAQFYTVCADGSLAR